MDRRFYFETLYPFQDEALEVLARLDTKLYLTQGTAASRGYLHHRFSDDLDLFANDAPEFGLWVARYIEALSSSARWRVEVVLREERFARANLLRNDMAMKIELVNDVPAHVGDLSEHPVLGRLDSPENILANKMTAIIDREEPKDLADVWLLLSHGSVDRGRLEQRPQQGRRPLPCRPRARPAFCHRDRLEAGSLDRAPRHR